MTLEAMDIVLKLWQEDGPFEFKGDYWNVKLDEKVPELGLGQVLKAVPETAPADCDEYRQGRVDGRHDRRAAGVHSNQHQYGTVSQGETAVGTLLRRCP